MSLSGLFNVGHDVGGFSGDKPDAELFVRWVQNGVMHPRFTIHSWNDDHTVKRAVDVSGRHPRYSRCY
ncbi:alpha-glucosidase 2 [Enterobacter cloacae]|uniref:Alpha-glucosidase 2 n=1 Tax=Enterobacter cloacae TaxID=550 RepID=A0A377M4Y3_ENTCL|nr:alpha-glucosidase 2 [Enterobacter cloacae]